MLAGRETALSFVGNAFWIALAVGTPVLIVWVIVAFIRFVRREVKQYRAEVGRDRRDGRPWLHTFVAWPAVFGLAEFHYFENACKGLTEDCLEQIPF